MKKITLKVYYSKKEQDFVVSYPTSKATGGYVIDHIVGRRVNSRLNYDGKDLWKSEKILYKDQSYTFIEHSFIKEMESRGYDIKTLKFSIKLDVNLLEMRFPEIYNSLSKEEKEKLGI